MELNEFYEQVKDVVLFPGSIDDLNKVDKKVGSGYVLLPMQGGRKFITGAIVPSKEEVKEMLRFMQGVASVLEDGGLEQELESEVKSTIYQLLGNPAVIELDLRLKAKKLGADGIVHVQLYSKDQMYFGVPVKLVNVPVYLGGRL